MTIITLGWHGSKNDCAQIALLMYGSCMYGPRPTKHLKEIGVCYKYQLELVFPLNPLINQTIGNSDRVGDSRL